ncbi:UNVERIFIED_CONTAM: hypothetical protein Slati_2465100 [Sesamum latifolium]|uniref:DUF4283 domain-containing protein n=1 Tax=Sesamum latifolium TaxID=2727402 RepID=A0AAW2WF03_9LAMI
MDSPKTLSSLTHTTPHTHTHPPAHNPSSTAADDDPIGGEALIVAGDIEGDSPTVGQDPCDFNLTEFLALASRVVDEGDADSWAALHSLKQRWMAKFGDGASTTPTGGLKPVAARPPTPFPPPMHAPRRAVRSITAPLARVLPRDSPPLLVADSNSPSTPLLLRMRRRLGMNPPPPIYVDNVPLNPTALPVDAIADAFHNSSRKTLSYVPPTLQNGEVIVRPSLDIIRSGSQHWSNMAVGYFLGRRLYFHHVNEFVRSVWPMVREVTASSSGFFFFQFKTNAAMEEVPMWIKLRHLPVELWTTEGLSTVASGIGKPLYPDAITRACTRLDFARVCIMLDINSKLPKHIVIMVPREDGSETPCKVDVEYEWLPPKCTACMTLGHSAKGCPTKKPRQPPVSVYVQKPGAGVRGPREEPEITAVLMATAAAPVWVRIWWNGRTRGLNHRDHQVSVANLVSEHRLQFVGLLEMRVSVGNVARVQRGLLPRWNWFVDYVSPGNRIWLAWDEDFIDLNVFDAGDQFIHCSAHIRSLHVHVLITVVYGVNDVVGRRVLWDALVCLSHTVHDVPWLVGGILTQWWMSVRFVGYQGMYGVLLRSFRVAYGTLVSLPCLCKGNGLLGITVVGMPGVFGSGWIDFWSMTGG